MIWPDPHHLDHNARPVGCNAWCDPDAGIHTEVTYGESWADVLPVRAMGPGGHRIEVIAERPAPPEAPRSTHPKCAAADAWVSTFRFLDPLVADGQP